jgi:hypothetical protein
MRLSKKLQQLVPLLAAVTATLGMSSGVAAAAPPSITTVLDFSSPTAFPPTPPYFGMWSGVFTANIAAGQTHSGTVSAQGVLPAPPPNNGQFETFRTLTTDSQDTIELRCTELVQALPSTAAAGTCAVIKAKGVYSALRGAGKLTGIADYTALTLTDTIVF